VSVGRPENIAMRPGANRRCRAIWRRATVAWSRVIWVSQLIRPPVWRRVPRRNAPERLCPADAHALAPPAKVFDQRLVVHRDALRFGARRSDGRPLAQLSTVARQQAAEATVEALCAFTRVGGRCRPDCRCPTHPGGMRRGRPRSRQWGHQCAPRASKGHARWRRGWDQRTAQIGQAPRSFLSERSQANRWPRVSGGVVFA